MTISNIEAICMGALLGAVLVACARTETTTYDLAPGAVCPSESGTYRVDVLIEMPSVTVHHDHSKAQLGLMAHHGSNNRVLGVTTSKLSPSNRVLGVTTSKLRVTTATHYANRPLPQGICFWVYRIEVTLRYEAFDIYVASEYTRNSCQYQAILSHLKKRPEVAQASLDDYVQTIRSVLASPAIPKARSPSLVENVTEAQKKTQATIGRLLQPIVGKLRQDIDAAQNRLDSRAERRRVETQCGAW